MSNSEVEEDVPSSDSDTEHVQSNAVPCVRNAEANLTECVGRMRALMNMEVISTSWLNIPDEVMNPKKMCAVNQFVHIVDKLGIEFNPHANELVLVSSGTTVSEHFRWMIHCINSVRSIF